MTRSGVSMTTMGSGSRSVSGQCARTEYAPTAACWERRPDHAAAPHPGQVRQAGAQRGCRHGLFIQGGFHALGGLLARLGRHEIFKRRADVHAVHAAGAALGERIKGADGIHFDIKKLDADGLIQLRRKHVEDIAQQGALPLALHHGHPFIAQGCQPGNYGLGVCLLAFAQGKGGTLKAVCRHEAGEHDSAEQIIISSFAMARLSTFSRCHVFTPLHGAKTARRAPSAAPPAVQQLGRTCRAAAARSDGAIYSTGAGMRCQRGGQVGPRFRYVV